jgi:hypothetical protein
MEQVTRHLCHCQRCGWEWHARNRNVVWAAERETSEVVSLMNTDSFSLPKSCPSCGSKKWNEPKSIPIINESDLVKAGWVRKLMPSWWAFLRRMTR